ncbi:MAG: DUF1223 domain-containing protein [Alphaproteobacteria bacterium]
MNKQLLYIPLLALSLAAMAALPVRAAQDGQITVVELFTSQGCNSCPPADALAGELDERPDVFVLSWNVDYWDMLGWQDTLASPENTQRQRDYNREMGRPGVYTPQMIVGGKAQVVGSDREAVESAIADSDLRAGMLAYRFEGDSVIISLPADSRAAKAVVTLVQYDTAQSVAIGSGENKGRSITYTHPVRKAERIGVWDGAAREIRVSKDQFCEAGNVILVQQGPVGAILHASLVGPVARQR